MRYRVVYLDHVARLSGGEIALLRAVTALQGQVSPHVILGEHGPLADRLRAIGISTEVMPLAEVARDARKDTVRPGAINGRAVLSSLWYVESLRRRLRELDPDLVHTNSLKAALYGGVAGRLAGVPVVWHIRDRIAPDYLPAAAIRMVRAAARVLPSAVVANSHSTLSTLPHLRRGVVVPNAVVYDAVTDPGVTSERADHSFRVGIIGRLAPWKGQQVFLDAFALAFPGDDAQAWVIGSAMFGEDAYADSLQKQVKQLGLGGRVVFRGFREDIWAELAQLDCLVHCSLIPEPFGQVILEGMAAGVPVIGAAAGGPAEIVTHEVDGLLTPPGEVVALGAAMRRMHDDPSLRRSLSTAGRKTGATFSPERTASDLLAVYSRVLPRSR